MLENEIIIECAKLDGKSREIFYDLKTEQFVRKNFDNSLTNVTLPLYTTSRDAIVLVIEKQREGIQRDIANVIWKDVDSKNPFTAKELTLSCMAAMLRSTPLQLCKALLRATGKWKD